MTYYCICHNPFLYMKILKEEIEKSYLGWFKERLMENGAPSNITDHQVKNSIGFESSYKIYETAFIRGWDLAKSLE